MLVSEKELRKVMLNIVKSFKKIDKYYLLYTLSFFFVLLCVFLMFFVSGTSLILSADGYNQVFPTLVYIKNYIREFLQGSVQNLPMYDWKVGYGENILYSLSWTGFGSPLSALIVLFPTDYLDVGYSCITIIKLYLIGISFSFYLRKRNYENCIVLSMSLAYVFSAYALLRAINYPVFLEAMISFPFIIGGIEDTIKNEMLSFRLIIGVFFQSLSGFYFLYIELVLAAIYYVILLLAEKRSFFIVKNGIKCVTGVIIGMGMGAGVLFPSIMGFLSSSRSTENVFSTMRIIDFSNFIIYAKGLFVPNKETMYTFPLLSVLLLITDFKNKHREKTRKIFLVIMLVGLFVPMFGSLLNGFSIVANDRWSFAIHFIIFVMVAEELQNCDMSTLKEKSLYYFVLSCPLLIFGIKDGRNAVEFIVACFFYLIFVFILGILAVNQQNKKLISGIIIINVILNGMLIMYPEQIGGLNEKEKYITYNQIGQQMENEFSVYLANKETNNNYRIDVIGNNLNIALYSGQAGCTEYLSVLNKNLYDYYFSYGLLPVAGTAHHLLNGLDNRAILEDIFAVKYYKDINENEIVENNNFCNLGLVYDKQYTKAVFEKMSMLDRMSALTQGVVLEEDYIQCAEVIYSEQEMIPYQMNCSESVISEGSYYSAQNMGKIVLQLSEGKREGDEIYLHIKQAKVIEGTCDVSTPSIVVNGKNVLVAGKEYVYYTGNSEVWLNTMINEDNRIEIIFPDAGVYELDEIEVYRYNVKMQEEQLDLLNSKNLFENIKVSSDRISGYVKDGSEKVLVLTIPYEKGWKVKINGQEGTCIKANNGLLGVFLETGENNIELTYCTPYRIVYIGIITVALIGFVGIIRRKMKKA